MKSGGLERLRRGSRSIGWSGLAAWLVIASACYGTPKPGHEGEAFRRMRRRDDVLGILLPVLAAGLLSLALIALRQRRSGKVPFDWLLGWYDAHKAARLQASSPAGDSSASAQAFARMTEMEAEEHARRDRKILGRDGTSVLLYVGQRVRVQSPKVTREGTLYDLSDEGLTLASSDLGGKVEVPWEQVLRIDAQYGPARRHQIPGICALLGLVGFGACGALIDEVALSAVVGGLVGAFLGTLVTYALPGPRWAPLIAPGSESTPISLATFAARASDPATQQRGMEGTPRDEILARVVIVLIVFGMCALLR